MFLDMQRISQAARAYGKEALSRKRRIAIGILVSVILFILSTHYLFEGINKRFIIYTALSLMTGVFLVFPRLKKWYLSLPLVVIYLAFVPSRLFYRAELPVHDLSALIDGAKLANLLIIYLVYAVLLLVSQRVGVALGGGGLVILLLSVVNYYVVEFRGTCLSFYDLFAIRTAATVMDSYQLTMSSELWYSILYDVFFIVLGFWCTLPWKKSIKYHSVITVASLAYLGAFWVFWDVSAYLEDHQLKGIYWSPSLNQPMEGFFLSFALNVKDMHMERPFGYSENTLRKIAQETTASYQSPVVSQEKQPSIIFIMNEAWSELKVLGDLETSEPYMSFIDSMEENTVKGWLTVEILGGLTANTEFEVLTGDSLTFLSATAVPYQLQVNHDMPSLARVTGEQGYQTMAMHPSIYHAWNRANVYEYMGFEEFVDVDKFQTGYEYVRGYISDECNFNEIIWQFEHKRENSPLFLFDVTIQNHGGYGGSGFPMYIERVGGQSVNEGKQFADVEDYLYLLKLTDDSFAKLISYFETVEEPVIVCMFGDHQPNLDNSFYDAVFEGQELTGQEQDALKYVVPYIIWTNYDAKLPEYGNMSANYLGAVVLECAGVDLPPYYQYLLQLREQYPVISHQTIMDIADDRSIQQYRMLQYNQLIVRDYMQELFSVIP